MQLKDLVKTLEDMTDEELQERLRQIRHRRTVERPAAKAKEARVEKKKSRTKMTALDKLIEGLSPQEQEDLIKTLEGNSGIC